ncbi:MAG TPA: response regulator transcription factor [Thermomicrobiales bacterium]|nr:response regulator transcription factor [Thermomicrobiales bacterium]
MAAPIRVLLADDHPLVRAGIRATLAAVPDVVLVAEAADGYAVQRLTQDCGFDVLVLDLGMSGPSATSLVRAVRARCPHARVLILTAHDEDAYVRGVVAAGAAGYVLKDEAPENLVQAIRSVARGGAWFSQAIVETLVRPERVDLQGPPDLTRRERELLHLVAQGRDNAEIAAELHLGEQTVRNYLSRLYTKLGVNSRAAAIIWARDHARD